MHGHSQILQAFFKQNCSSKFDTIDLNSHFQTQNIFKIDKNIVKFTLYFRLTPAKPHLKVLIPFPYFWFIFFIWMILNSFYSLFLLFKIRSRRSLMGNKNCVLLVGNTGKSCLGNSQSNCAIRQNKCLPCNNRK